MGNARGNLLALHAYGLLEECHGVYTIESLPLEGFAKLSSAKDGIIFVEQTLYAKSDPTCCPSVNKQAKYRWLGKTFAKVR